MEMVLVDDDVAIRTPGRAGRRGLAGTVLIHKVGVQGSRQGGVGQGRAGRGRAGQGRAGLLLVCGVITGTHA